MAQVIILGPGSRAGAYSKVARYHLNATRGGRGSTARVGLNYARYAFGEKLGKCSSVRLARSKTTIQVGGWVRMAGDRRLGRRITPKSGTGSKPAAEPAKYTVKLVLSAERGAFVRRRVANHHGG